MTECRRLGIRFAYIGKVEVIKHTTEHGLPYSEGWVILTAFSYQEGILIRLKGAFYRHDLTFSKNWELNPDAPEKKEYEKKLNKVLQTFDKWRDQLKEWLYVGQGVLSISEEKEILASEETPNATK